jgi:hypothetical protein
MVYNEDPIHRFSPLAYITVIIPIIVKTFFTALSADDAV